MSDNITGSTETQPNKAGITQTTPPFSLRYPNPPSAEPLQPIPTPLIRRRIPHHGIPRPRNIHHIRLRRIHRNLRITIPRPPHNKVHKPPLHHRRHRRQHRHPQAIRLLPIKKRILQILRVHPWEIAKLIPPTLIAIRAMHPKGNTVHERLCDSEFRPADLRGVGLRAREVGRVDYRGEVGDFGGR